MIRRQLIGDFNKLRQDAIAARRDLTIHREACGMRIKNWDRSLRLYPVPPRCPADATVAPVSDPAEKPSLNPQLSDKERALEIEREKVPAHPIRAGQRSFCVCARVDTGESGSSSEGRTFTRGAPGGAAQATNQVALDSTASRLRATFLGRSLQQRRRRPNDRSPGISQHVLQANSPLF